MSIKELIYNEIIKIFKVFTRMDQILGTLTVARY
jgi:hypothetical protein